MPDRSEENTPMLDLGAMVDQVVEGIQQASGSFLTEGRTLRSRLVDDGLIRVVPTNVEPPATMCAVDGGRITKQLYSGDLLVAYAAAAEAESSAQEGESFTQQWSAALRGGPGWALPPRRARLWASRISGTWRPASPRT